MHSELNVYGQVLAVSELTQENMMSEIPETGNTMMFCLHFGEGKEAVVRKIYDSPKTVLNFSPRLKSAITARCKRI
jgi:PhnB protein